MVDRKRKETPDILGSLLGEGETEPRRPADRPARRSAGQNTAETSRQNAGTPERHHTIKTATEVKPVITPAPVKESVEISGKKLKATFYLSIEILESLDEGWIKLRKMVPKTTRGQISKSLIVELAVQSALSELESKGEKSLLARKVMGE